MEIITESLKNIADGMVLANFSFAILIVGIIQSVIMVINLSIMIKNYKNGRKK